MGNCCGTGDPGNEGYVPPERKFNKRIDDLHEIDEKTQAEIDIKQIKKETPKMTYKGVKEKETNEFQEKTVREKPQIENENIISSNYKDGNKKDNNEAMQLKLKSEINNSELNSLLSTRDNEKKTNTEDLTKNKQKYEELGGYSYLVNFTEGEGQILNLINNTENDFSNILGKTKKLENLNELEKGRIKRIVTFEMIDSYNKQGQKNKLINDLMHMLKNSFSLEEEDKKQSDNAKTSNRLSYSERKGIKQQSDNNYTEKQQEFVAKLYNSNKTDSVYNAFRRSSSIIKSNRKEIPILKNLDLEEIDKLNSSIIADIEFLKRAELDDIEILPEYEKSKLIERIKNTPVGTQDFKTLRESIVNENVNSLRKLCKNKSLTKILPNDTVKENYKDLEKKINDPNYDPDELINYKIQLKKIKKFFDLINNDELIVVTVKKEDINKVKNTFQEEENGISKLKSKTAKSFTELNNIIKSIEDDKKESMTFKDILSLQKKLHESKKDSFDSPALVDMTNFFSGNFAKDKLKIGFFNPQIKDFEVLNSDSFEKKEVLSAIFSNSINEIENTRIKIRDELNISFKDYLEAESKNKVRLTTPNMGEKNKIEDDQQNIKRLLAEINNKSEEEIEKIRLDYYSKKKAEMIVDENEDEDVSNNKNMGNMF